MRNKSEALDMFKMYVTKIENQLSKKIKRLRSDRGIEYGFGLCNNFFIVNMELYMKRLLHILLK